ncbi:MAG: hypothetical protein Fur0037_15440 [Planctomycetota bacterium]
MGIHVRLLRDGTGTLTARALSQPAEPGQAEAVVQGVAWLDRAELTFSQGSFQDVKDLSFGGIRFLGDVQNPDRPGLRILVPRGPDAAWVKALAPSEDLRRRIAKVYDPTGKSLDPAPSVRIDIVLPGNVVSAGVQPAGRGVEADHERDRAWLSIPIAKASEKGEELVFDVSWVAAR